MKPYMAWAAKTTVEKGEAMQERSRPRERTGGWHCAARAEEGQGSFPTAQVLACSGEQQGEGRTPEQARARADAPASIE